MKSRGQYFTIAFKWIKYWMKVNNDRECWIEISKFYGIYQEYILSTKLISGKGTG